MKRIITSLLTVAGIAALQTSAYAADPYLARFESKISRAESLASLVFKEQPIVTTPIDLLESCDGGNGVFRECDVPRELVLGVIDIPAEFWNASSSFTMMTSLDKFQVSSPFILEGPLNDCNLELGPTKTLYNCMLGGRPSDLASAQAKLALRVPALPKWESGRDKIYKYAVGRIESLTFTPHPVVLIENMNALVEEMILRVDSYMDDQRMLQNLRDGLLYDANTIKILYTQLTEERSIGSTKIAKSGSKPLVGYPYNKITKADNKTLVDDAGQPILGKCGDEFTSHDSKHCVKLYYVARLMCEKGVGTIVTPDFEVTDLCMGGQGVAKNELDAKTAQLEENVAKMDSLQQRLFTLADSLKASILKERVASIDHQIETYRNGYKVYRAIVGYEKHTKKQLPLENWASYLRSDPGIEGWQGPYLSDADLTTDGWGSEFVFSRQTVGNSVKVVLTSPGPNKATGSTTADSDNLVFENGERRR